MFPLSPTLDTVGPLVRRVEDCVLLDAAMRGALTSSVRRTPLDGLHLMVATNVVFDGAEVAVIANFEASLERLAAVGVRVERRRVPQFDEFMERMATHGSLVPPEAYVVHRDRIESPQADRIDRRIVDRLLGGKRMSAYDLLCMQEARVRLTADIAHDLGDALLAIPTVAHVAPEIAPLEADDELFHAVNVKTLRNTMIGNFLDLCSLALPNGTDDSGMPTSFQLSASGGQDERLLSYGLAVEAVLQES